MEGTIRLKPNFNYMGTKMINDYMKDPEFQELIRKYLDYLNVSLPELKNNIAQEEYYNIRRYGHNLIGSGGGYGFDDLTELGRNINLSAHEENQKKLKELFEELEKNITEKQAQFSPSDLT